MYLLSEITKGENNQTEIESIDRYLLNLNKPIRFTGSNGFEVSYDKNFEEVNIILRHRLSIEPEKMTVMQYYTALDYLKQQNKKKK